VEACKMLNVFMLINGQLPWDQQYFARH
jgi:hypothetical protein